MKLPLLAVVGPTAVGKSGLSVALARRIGAEVISGDSMQVYRGLDIGTAKILPAEMQGVPHHLIDVKEPDQEFSVAEFQARVDRLIAEIASRGRIPLLVGGTGLYIRSVVMKYTFAEQDADRDLRRRLALEEHEHGPGYLHRRLRGVDPLSAERLHPNDLRRIIRALEVHRTTGLPISAAQTAWQHEPRYDHLLIGLTMEREQLYRRIGVRVDTMLTTGLTDEVRGLLARYPPHLPALQSIGYRETVSYLRGLLTLDECRELIKRNTRRYAKRQYTWFRKELGVSWFDLTKAAPTFIVEAIARLVEGKWQIGVEADKSGPEK